MILSSDKINLLIERTIENANEKFDDAKLLFELKKYPTSYYNIFLVKEEIAKAWYLFRCMLKNEEINDNNLRDHDKKIIYYKEYCLCMIFGTRFNKLNCERENGNPEPLKNEIKNIIETSRKENIKNNRKQENKAIHCENKLELKTRIKKIFELKDIARYGQVKPDGTYISPRIIDEKIVSNEISFVEVELNNFNKIVDLIKSSKEIENDFIKFFLLGEISIDLDL